MLFKVRERVQRLQIATFKGPMQPFLSQYQIVPKADIAIRCMEWSIERNAMQPRSLF